MLFLREACPLPLADAEKMLRAWTAPGVVGCWYPTITNEFVIIDRFGTHENSAPWQILPQASLHPDGSLTLTEIGYDSETFTSRVMQVLSAEAGVREAP
jgi:hypothetical protein